MRNECDGTSLRPVERWGPDSPHPVRGTCPKCGKSITLTLAGFLRAHGAGKERNG